jgi:alpha-glucosidase
MFNSAKHYVNTGGKEPPIDLELGMKRARAVSLALLSLPGAQFIYQSVFPPLLNPHH